MNFKKWLIDSLGIISTAAAILIIYMVLWLENPSGFGPGSAEPDYSMYTEFAIITGLAVYCKVFWYKSCENNVRTSEKYLLDRQALSDEISNTITNPQQFDDFIFNENNANYNRFMSSKCQHLTLKNYKLSFFDKLYKLFKPETPTEYFFNAYIIRCENKAKRINQLSAARVTSGTNCFLVDDRNFAGRDKLRYIVFGTVLSIAMFGLFASINLKKKEDMDVLAAITKMIMYSVSMLFNILTTILSATMNTRRDDYDYMRRIYDILDRYKQYVINPIKIERINYLIEQEVKDVVGNNQVETCIQQQFDFNSLGFTE